MGLFSDIYNTVAKFFRPQEEIGDASKSVATNRLKLVLMQDRTNLTPKILEQMRSELIDLLSRYVELDKELLDLNFEQEGDQVALMLSIPVIRAKDEEEIEAAIKAHQESLITEMSSECDIVDSDENNNDINNESNEKSEEELEAENVENIEKELPTSGKTIKKKEVSAPEEIVNNSFKQSEEQPSEILENS